MYIGATLGKGINRAVATLVAGGLGVGAHHLASLSGPTIEPILLAVFVFVQGNHYNTHNFIEYQEDSNFWHIVTSGIMSRTLKLELDTMNQVRSGA